jgi:hypothetical protein
MRRSTFLVVLLGVLAAAGPAGAAERHLKLVYTGAGHASIAQYRDSTKPDTQDNWDVYTKDVSWKVTIPFTVEGGQVTATGAARGSVSGTGTQLGRSGGITSCNGPVALPKLAGKSTVPLALQVRGATHNKIKLRIVSTVTSVSALPLVWAFVPACGTSIGNATGTLVPVELSRGVASFAAAVDHTDLTLLPADNFRPQTATFGDKWPLAPQDFQRKVDYAFHSRVKVEQR